MLLFSLLMGTLVTTIGYTPFFVGLAVLDLVGACILWTVVQEPAAASAPSGGRAAVAESMSDAALRIHNPILPGFNPDPSIVRVGDDYYIATSTFEWFPGVQIHHSRDLVHWRLLTRPLRRPRQLNMLGDPDSCGVWAPCLTHADGLFYLGLHRREAVRADLAAGRRGRIAARLPQLPRHERARSTAIGPIPCS